MIMTLAEWGKKYGVEIMKHQEGGTYICTDLYFDAAMAWDLYHLEDYAVSSRWGLVAWLVRRAS